MESQEAGFPPFPHSHGLDCGHVSKVNNKRKARKPDLRPFHRKGLVTDVPGPKCNERSSTLIPQQAWFPCIRVKRRDLPVRAHCRELTDLRLMNDDLLQSP